MRLDFPTDATRKRRWSKDSAKRKWYATARTLRFRRHYFGIEVVDLAIEFRAVVAKG